MVSTLRSEGKSEAATAVEMPHRLGNPWENRMANA